MSTDLGGTLFSARSLHEYRAMFALTDSDLTGRVLDCPGGAASSTAEIVGAGGDAVAVDPLYARPAAELAALARAEARRGNAYTAGNAERYVWTWFPDLAAHHQARVTAADTFARDVVAHPERYVAAALPHLPFPDRAFDLVLSAHLLFTYGDRLDAELHLQALLELCRVTRSDVRLFPLLEHSGRRDELLLHRVRTGLDEHGVDSDVVRVEYEVQRGGDQMLVLRPR